MIRERGVGILALVRMSGEGQYLALKMLLAESSMCLLFSKYTGKFETLLRQKVDDIANMPCA